MKLIVKQIIHIYIFLLSLGIVSQNTADFSVFSYNLSFVNPAFAGTNNKIQLASNYKKVWSSLENTIHANIVSFSMPFENRLGFGVNILSDHFNLYNHTVVSADFSYTTSLNLEHELLFGLKASGSFFNTQLNKVTTHIAGDPLFTEINSGFRPNFSVGLALKNKNYFTHIAFHDIIKNRPLTNIATSVNYMRIVTGGGFYSKLTNDFELTTTALVRIIKGAPLNIDIGSMLNIYKKYDLGITYRWDTALMGNFLIELNEWLQMGYSYGLPTNSLASHSTATHELFLKIHFNSKHKNKYNWRYRCFY